MPAPWGAGNAASSGGLQFKPVADQATTQSTAAGSGVVPSGGARTHYALDAYRDDHPLARIVVVDSSLRSLEAADTQQAPTEGGGQLAWLRAVLSSRPVGEQAIVVSETPGYSYGPGNGTDTASDATTVESILAQYHVNLVVSGRVGWNALYWTTAAGLHCPGPGDTPPDPSAVPTANQSCSAASSQVAAAHDPVGQAQQLASTIQGTAPPAAPSGCTGSGDNSSGVIPNVIASSAGGKFGPADSSAQGSANQGFWHGYTVVRLDRSGDPRCTLVEQRPVFDWAGVSAVTHTLKPGQHMTLRGYGREPAGLDQPIRYDDVNSPAVTHRFDLVEADPQRPWLPKACGCPEQYTELDPAVGKIDRQTGAITTGSGNHSRVYAIAMLSVGAQAASWPLAFEPRRSFSARSPILIPAAEVAASPIHVAAIAATAPPPASTPPPPPPPGVGTPSLPQLPGLPSLPPLNTPPPAAPPPPAGAAPPAPPASQAPTALSISASPQGIGFAVPAGVVPPPAPPVNPAPPGGAKREAKAKQPAAAKSEESGAAEEGKAEAGDLAQGPMGPQGSPMTRHSSQKPGLAFTAISSRGQPSAWARGLQYGGGLALMALIVALGFATVGPTPRRRRQAVAAPAQAPARPGSLRS
jgi:hypothetical protein